MAACYVKSTGYPDPGHGVLELIHSLLCYWLVLEVLLVDETYSQSDLL
jgi:hypothetical protein